MAQRPRHHRRVLCGPLAGRWVPLVSVDANSACARHAQERADEACAIAAAGAQLTSGPVPGTWFRHYWAEMADVPNVHFEYLEACSSDSFEPVDEDEAVPAS